jgi:hypothetical protein
MILIFFSAFISIFCGEIDLFKYENEEFEIFLKIQSGTGYTWDLDDNFKKNG